MTSNDPDLTDAAPCGSHGSRPALAMSASSLGGLDWTEVLKHRKWHHDSDQSGRVGRWSWTCGGVRAHSDRSCLPGPASPADTQNMFWCQNPEDHSSFMSFRNLNLFNLSSHQCFSNVSSHRIASRGFKKKPNLSVMRKRISWLTGRKTHSGFSYSLKRNVSICWRKTIKNVFDVLFRASTPEKTDNVFDPEEAAVQQLTSRGRQRLCVLMSRTSAQHFYNKDVI